MFSTDIIDADSFLDMPLSSRCLYYDLGMRADDDGFVSPKKVIRLTGASDDDLKVLIAKNFIIPFKSGVIVIKDWKMNNYIKNDRYTETIYKEEKELLLEDKNKSYSLKSPESIQVGDTLDPQVRLGKVSKDKVNTISKDIGKPKVYGNPDINFLIDYLKQSLELPNLDLSVKVNRQYANTLLKKSKKGVEGVKWLIDMASSDPWFKNHITSFRDLWSNQMKIVSNTRKGASANGRTNITVIRPDTNWNS